MAETKRLQRDGAPVALLRKSVRHVTGTAELRKDGGLHRPLTVDIVAAAATHSTDVKRPPLWLVIEEIMSGVSDDEMARVPPANSRTIDRKLYGRKAKGTRAKK